MGILPQSGESVQEIFECFLARLANSFESRDVFQFSNLFLPNGYLRDLLICNWDLASVSKNSLQKFFQTHQGLPVVDPASIKVDSTKTLPLFNSTVKWIQGFFVFETLSAFGEGVARIQLDADTGVFRALTLSFSLHQLKGHSPLVDLSPPIGIEHGLAHNYLERRELASYFKPELPYPNPTVIILGAGHSGLMLGARLKRLGILTLIVDRGERLGDSWRKRYHSLMLQDTIWSDVFPYLPFPDDWPIHIPKDKMASWLESYAITMDLHVWLQSTVEPSSTSYDEATETWTLSIRRGDGSLRKLRCKHVVQATGGEPNIPHFEGEETFKGSMYHSSTHNCGTRWKGRKAVVIGCGNSAHDIARDFYSTGAAEVTMVQRSATAVVSSTASIPRLQYDLGYHEGGPPTEEVDLSVISFPYKAFEPYAVATHAAINEEDKEIIEGLERVGFKTRGKGGPGLLYQYFRHPGGFHINFGCSTLIIDGKINIKQGQDVKTFEETGVRFADGSFLEADVVVLATGYRPMRETCRKVFGAHIADQTEVWKMDPASEIHGIWKHSDCPGFWYIGGGILLSRMYSKYVALWIQAIEQKIAPKMQPQVS